MRFARDGCPRAVTDGSPNRTAEKNYHVFIDCGRCPLHPPSVKGGWLEGWHSGEISHYNNNPPVVVPLPANFKPQVPSGFGVSIFAKGFTQPRWLAIAPNGDVFAADSAIGEVVVLDD